jgi:hypothetical protein
MGLFLRNVSQAGAVLDYVQGESSGEEYKHKSIANEK